MEPVRSHFSHLAPRLTTHLTDREANPILSTHPEPAVAAQPLSALSSAFVQAYETASRLGLGVPLRITLSTAQSNIVVIQSAPNPTADSLSSTATESKISPRMPSTTMEGLAGESELSSSEVSGLLVGTVVAPGNELAEARLAIWGIEDVARRLQNGVDK